MLAQSLAASSVVLAVVLQVQVLSGAFALGFTKAQCGRVLHSLPIQKEAQAYSCITSKTTSHDSLP